MARIAGVDLPREKRVEIGLNIKRLVEWRADGCRPSACPPRHFCSTPCPGQNSSRTPSP